MSSDPQVLQKRRTKIWVALGLAGFLVVLLVAPPLIGINRYKSRITQLVSASLGRPVRLSGVELRLLPRPGFLLSDLTVQEDPAFGAEPVLHATEVKASIRLTPLWRGRLQISRISVDEASLNLVRRADGRWNLDSLFRRAKPKLEGPTVGTGSGAAQPPSGLPPSGQPLPYLEATNSRINIKNGIEKLPFSLVNADASMWQESDGAWRVRLRGQPARTDVTLDLADTGIVRLEATLHPAAQLNQMPVHLDADWREAQLGQLTRLVLGSDEGWRGNLTGEVHLDGTASSAKVAARLSASGVHRAEFAPAAPLDFDATCAFTYRYSQRSVEKMECDSPLGNGRARLTGDLPGAQPPRMTLELDRIPAQAALDLLRTMRRRIDPSIQAAGTVSGHMTYDPAAAVAVPDAHAKKARAANLRGAARHAEAARPARGPLTGSFVVDGLRISGDALSRPIVIGNSGIGAPGIGNQAGKMTLEPAPEQAGDPAALNAAALIATVEIPAGGPSPLAVTARLALKSFELGVRGTAALARLREFAHATGSPAEGMLGGLAGEPASLDLTVKGPWLPPVEVLLAPVMAPGPAPANSLRVNGTIALRDANWKTDFLASAVLINSATLHIEDGELRWAPIAFSYGPVKGTATMDIPTSCEPPKPCAPKFTAKFGALDAEAAESALLGAREKGTLLSTVLSRLKLGSATPWPQMEGTAQADSLIVGPFTFGNAAADLKITATGAEIASFNGSVLGGTIHGKGSLTVGDQPAYSLDGDFTGLNAGQVGQLAGMTWTGGPIGGSGHVEMAGFTDKDLGRSAKGTLHFEWLRGGVMEGAGAGGDEAPAAAELPVAAGVPATAGVPASLARFDRWIGDATVANGGMTLGENQVLRGGRKSAVQGTMTFGVPAQVVLGPAKGQSTKP